MKLSRSVRRPAFLAAIPAVQTLAIVVSLGAGLLGFWAARRLSR